MTELITELILATATVAMATWTLAATMLAVMILAGAAVLVVAYRLRS